MRKLDDRRTDYSQARLDSATASGCGGTVPVEEMGKNELFVTVTAPEGTLHETFFDPNEALAVAFTDGPVDRITWDAGAVTASTDDLDTLAGHTVEFTALDGSVSLSLAVAEAQVDATKGTLTWKVAEQPWQSGDKLMLRISV